MKPYICYGSFGVTAIRIQASEENFESLWTYMCFPVPVICISSLCGQLKEAQEQKDKERDNTVIQIYLKVSHEGNVHVSSQKHYLRV